MSDRVFPSSKPSANAAATNPTASDTVNPTAPPKKTHLTRPPYRPQPHNRRYRTRSGRSIFCCCCFWSFLILLLLILLAAIAGAALYIMYRPHRPSFSIPSLRVHRLKLTTSADSSSSHISTLLNLTIISKNPNSHLTFFYDPFTVSSFSNDVFLGNGTLPAYSLSKKNETSFRDVVISGSNNLDADSVNTLSSDLKKKSSGVALKIQLDTKVKVKIGAIKTKKLGIRVTCEGFKGAVPKGKSPTVAVTTDSKCKVDLRIKIWKWTF